MPSEFNNLFVNLIMISLPIIIIEGLIGGYKRSSSKVINNLNLKKDQVIKSKHISNVSSVSNVSNLQNVNVENESKNSNASKVSNYKSHQNKINQNANLEACENNELLIEQRSKIEEQQLKLTTLNELKATFIEKQQTTSLPTKLNSKLTKDPISENAEILENVEQRKDEIVKIPTMYILVYIFFIFITLFLTFYFRRSIIKLYNLIYACLIAFVTFYYLDLFTCKLFKKNSILNKVSLMNFASSSNKHSLFGLFDLIDLFSFLILFAVSFALSYYWYSNRLNQCIWLFHNLVGYLICLFIVCSIRLINFRQIFIALSLFTCLDVFFAHFSKYFFNGISMTSTITRSFVKRDLDIEELDLSLHLNSSEMNNLDAKIYRMPSIFFIPKFSLVDALALNFHCTSSTTNFAIIGFLDLVIAGIISSYCNYFDRMKRTYYIYFLTSIISNLVGLILMVLVNDLLESKGMPVLLFICPINFLCILTLAFYRQEFKEFWSLEPIKENYSNVNQSLKEDAV